MTKTLRSALLGAGLVLGALSALPATASAQGCNTTFEVVNRGAEPVMEVHIRPTGTSGWSRDLLGRSVLGRGDRLTLTPAQGGYYDVMVRTLTGRVMVAAAQNVCRLATVTVS
ncbi:hypothetical protein M0638_28615 [Roseomonas sp. NAR14]|uniref:Uncharacterized protein n=1 Tax=Roseomonas acroporae TaxID=2937791 RepID=A0A9X1YEN1_9PROT|nr:hypothetical protein [Roseomonas acroporae]MCK8788320.1 hypothetical protein [Roseomonas acroporae]